MRQELDRAARTARLDVSEKFQMLCKGRVAQSLQVLRQILAPKADAFFDACGCSVVRMVCKTVEQRLSEGIDFVLPGAQTGKVEDSASRGIRVLDQVLVPDKE